MLRKEDFPATGVGTGGPAGGATGGAAGGAWGGFLGALPGLVELERGALELRGAPGADTNPELRGRVQLQRALTAAPGAEDVLAAVAVAEDEDFDNVTDCPREGRPYRGTRLFWTSWSLLKN